MERLTKRNGDGYSLNHDACPKHGDCYDSADCVDVLVNDSEHNTSPQNNT